MAISFSRKLFTYILTETIWAGVKAIFALGLLIGIPSMVSMYSSENFLQWLTQFLGMLGMGLVFTFPFFALGIFFIAAPISYLLYKVGEWRSWVWILAGGIGAFFYMLVWDFFTTKDMAFNLERVFAYFLPVCGGLLTGIFSRNAIAAQGQNLS